MVSQRYTEKPCFEPPPHTQKSDPLKGKVFGECGRVHPGGKPTVRGRGEDVYDRSKNSIC